MKILSLFLVACCLSPSVFSNEIVLKPKVGVKDYAPIIQEHLETLAKQGGGTLKVSYGNYPMLNQVHLTELNKSVIVTIKGINGQNNAKPFFYDTAATKNPHSFFVFQGNIGVPNLTVNILNIHIKGNNQPFTAAHPFVNKVFYTRAIACLNTNTVTIKNVDISNFYGDGIMLSQGMDTREKKFRVNKPIIADCKILNTWGWGPSDDSKDGIMLWQVNAPLVENCLIVNDVNVTKHKGRCGIVLEHNTENAIVRNNVVGGYDRNLHIECDFGGHLITKNTFKYSNNAVTLSYDCNQPISRKNDYRPIVIENNTFNYFDELSRIKSAQNDFGFISIHKKSFVLNGLKIRNNTFLTTKGKVKVKNTTDGVIGAKRYIWLGGQENVIIEQNVYK